MDYEEYRERLDALRKEHADVVRFAVEDSRDDFVLLIRVGSTATFYQERVDALIEEYNRQKENR